MTGPHPPILGFPGRQGDAEPGPPPGPGDVCDGQQWSIEGPTADWSEGRFEGCYFAAEVQRLNLIGTRIVTSRLGPVRAGVIDARGSSWRTVAADQLHSASLDLSEATISGLSVRGSRLGYVNLRAAQVADLLLTGCLIDTLDCADAEWERVALVDCRVRELIVRRARCRDVDLRGAELSALSGTSHLAGCAVTPAQWTDLSPSLAAELRIMVLEPQGVDAPGDPDTLRE